MVWDITVSNKWFLCILQGIFTTWESSELRCLGQKAPEAVSGPQA